MAEAEVAFDVVEQILLRSDAQVLIRCKSVCKSLHSLISTPRFVKDHLNQSHNADRHNTQLGHRRIGFHITLNENYRSHRKKVFFVGSCNGLVCISTKGSGKFVVTNPLTREINRLPTPPYGLYGGERVHCVVCWGFGYDSCIDDYKVVLGFMDPCNDENARFHVLTLKSNTWKIIGDKRLCKHAYAGLSGLEGVLCGGALHWFVSNEWRKNRVIISFDLSTEKFREIPRPTHEEYECVDDPRVEGQGHRLGVVEECLCVYKDWSAVGKYNNLDYLPRWKWVMKNDKWEVYNDDCCESKYDVAHNVVVVEKSPTRVYGVDDGIRVPSAGHFMRASLFVKSLVSPHPHPLPHPHEGQHVKGQEGDESVESGAKAKIRKRKRNKSSCQHKKALV
ncbi:F-box protein CPR1-like [Bidens hawaiensis]|uniref:F-box protein CPR1-like n=1 Tax=Bidens hawaiensis TaxID=980011 RepID=UPI004049C9AA